MTTLATLRARACEPFALRTSPRRRRAAVRWWAPLLVLAACCGGKGLAPVPLPNAAIVRVHAEGAFESHFERATDRPHFAAFVERTAGAVDRAGLAAAWRDLPALREKGDDFLERQVFARALRDEDWVAPPEPERHEPAFVQGTREAAAEFAKEPEPR